MGHVFQTSRTMTSARHWAVHNQVVLHQHWARRMSKPERRWRGRCTGTPQSIIVYLLFLRPLVTLKLTLKQWTDFFGTSLSP